MKNVSIFVTLFFFFDLYLLKSNFTSLESNNEKLGPVFLMSCFYFVLLVIFHCTSQKYEFEMDRKLKLIIQNNGCFLTCRLRNPSLA